MALKSKVEMQAFGVGYLKGACGMDRVVSDSNESVYG